MGVDSAIRTLEQLVRDARAVRASTTVGQGSSHEQALRHVVLDAMRTALAEQRGVTVDEDGYLSIAKAARLADVHPDTLRAWIKEGRLPEHRAGRELRVRRSELHRLLAGSAQTVSRPSPEEEAATILSRRRKA